LFAAAIGAALCSATTLWGQITLDAEFDSGSLDETNSFAVGNMVTLAGRDNYNPGDWKWLYFSANNVNSQQVTFQIGDNFNTGSSSLIGHEMVYSYDQENWEFFDNNVRNSGAGTYTFFNDTAFTQNQVYVAYGLPYSYQRTVDHTAQISTSPYVSPTPVGAGDLIVGQSPGGIDDLGRVIAPRDMFSYRITDPAETDPKVKIVLNGGTHANETLGNYTLEGLVNFLVSDELEAGILRREAEFFVYPMANPDGRFAGYNRSTVQVPDEDPNRFWDPPSYGGMSDIDLVGTAMKIDTGNDTDYFIDFHSTVNGKTGHYGYVWAPFQSDPFWLKLTQLEPSIITNGASLIDLTGGKFGRDELNAEFSITFETEFIAGENIDRFHSLGRNFGLAWAQVLHSPADLNFDGNLDALDWAMFIAGAETDLSGMSPIDAYTSGDLDGDGVNSVLDFGIFKNAYNSGNGAGAFERMLSGVPEPSSAALALIGALLCGYGSANSLHGSARKNVNIHWRILS
jgi:hypothetical protein